MMSTMDEKNSDGPQPSSTGANADEQPYYQELPKAPPKPPHQVTEREIAAVKAEFESNREKRKQAIVIGLIVAAVSLVSLGLLVQNGLNTTTYREAQQAADNASVFGWILAGISGFLLAYFMAHPTNHPQVTGKSQISPLAVVFIIGGLFFGIIPGLVIGLIYGLHLRNKKKRFETDPDQPLAIKRAGTAGLVFAFLFGMIPGAVLYFIISYPLSQHACKLSGSKYC